MRTPTLELSVTAGATHLVAVSGFSSLLEGVCVLDAVGFNLSSTLTLTLTRTLTLNVALAL